MYNKYTIFFLFPYFSPTDTIICTKLVVYVERAEKKNTVQETFLIFIFLFCFSYR